MDRDNFYNNMRPDSAQLVDIHVYIVPPDLWRETLNSAVKEIINDTISAGFIRVHPESTVYSLREEVESQLGFEAFPRDYVFLKSVGRCFTRIRPKQEQVIKAKNFIPPQTYAPEIYVLEAALWQEMPYSGASSSSSRVDTQRSNRSDFSGHPVIPPIPNSNKAIQTGQDDSTMSDLAHNPLTKSSHFQQQNHNHRHKAIQTQTNFDTGHVVSPKRVSWTPDHNETHHKSEAPIRRPPTPFNQEKSSQYSPPSSPQAQVLVTSPEPLDDDDRSFTPMSATPHESPVSLQPPVLIPSHPPSPTKDSNPPNSAPHNKHITSEADSGVSDMDELERQRLEDLLRRNENNRKDLRRSESPIYRQNPQHTRRSYDTGPLHRVDAERGQYHQRKLQEEEERKIRERELEERRRRELEEEERRKRAAEEKQLEEERLRWEEEERQRAEEEENLRRKEEAERLRKEEEERRKRLEEEDRMRREEEEEERRRNEENARRQQEEERERYASPQQMSSSNADEKARLLSELESLRGNRTEMESQREELVKRIKSLQHRSSNKRNQARDVWKRKYFDEKKKTPPLEDQTNRLRQELDSLHRRIMSTLESSKKDAQSHRRPGEPSQLEDQPDSENNLKIQATRYQHDIDDYQRKVENVKMRLTAEMKLRAQAETDLRALRAELTQKKINVTITRSQQFQAMQHGVPTSDYQAPALVTPRP